MDMKSLLRRLVESESPSHDKAAVDRAGVIVAEEARKLDAQVEIIPNKETGDHVLAHFEFASPTRAERSASAVEAGRRSRGKSGILLLCHLDTVFPLGTLEKMPYRESDGNIFGPGTLDMKAGIVIA